MNRRNSLCVDVDTYRRDIHGRKTVMVMENVYLYLCVYIEVCIHTDIQMYTNGGEKVLLVLSDEAYVSTTHMYMNRSIYVDIHWREKAGALLMKHMYLHVCIYVGMRLQMWMYTWCIPMAGKWCGC